jgi:(p)ppGpp synthase/HD superfamily hydrolase
MRQPKNVMRDWLRSVSTAQAREAAKIAGTSIKHLQHIAAGRRGVSAELAQRLAHATTRVSGIVNGLEQQTLCKACAKCPIALP